MSTVREKTIEMIEIIRQLYVVEGKSLNYISKLLSLARKEMTEVVKQEYKMERGNVRQTTPKIRKLLAAHKDNIINYLKNTQDREMGSYLATLGIDNNLLWSMRNNDKELNTACVEFVSKESLRSLAKKKREEREKQWSLCCEDMPGEEWRAVLGYEGLYEVSSFGRIKAVWGAPHILSPSFNPRIGRYQITLFRNGKAKGHKVYRLVAHAFVENTCPEERTTVNHMDGDPTNDVASNLEWATQKEQNRHKYGVLKRKVAEPYGRNGKFSRVVIDDTFSFKTLAAASRFLCVSESQIQRYIRGECPCDRKIELIY